MVFQQFARLGGRKLIPNKQRQRLLLQPALRGQQGSQSQLQIGRQLGRRPVRRRWQRLSITACQLRQALREQQAQRSPQQGGESLLLGQGLGMQIAQMPPNKVGRQRRQEASRQLRMFRRAQQQKLARLQRHGDEGGSAGHRNHLGGGRLGPQHLVQLCQRRLRHHQLAKQGQGALGIQQAALRKEESERKLAADAQ